MATPVTRTTTESQARRTDALASALGPLQPLLADDRVVEILLNEMLETSPKSGAGTRLTSGFC
jgi:Flp pilus assembly CpaF family ATPase